MGADPRQRFAEIEAELARLEAELLVLGNRVSELERLLLAITRSNAGKEQRRVGA